MSAPSQCLSACPECHRYLYDQCAGSTMHAVFMYSQLPWLTRPAEGIYCKVSQTQKPVCYMLNCNNQIFLPIYLSVNQGSDLIGFVILFTAFYNSIIYLYNSPSLTIFQGACLSMEQQMVILSGHAITLDNNSWDKQIQQLSHKINILSRNCMATGQGNIITQIKLSTSLCWSSLRVIINIYYTS